MLDPFQQWMTQPPVSGSEWKTALNNDWEESSLVIKKKVQIQITLSSTFSPINEELQFIQTFLAQP